MLIDDLGVEVVDMMFNIICCVVLEEFFFYCGLYKLVLYQIWRVLWFNFKLIFEYLFSEIGGFDFVFFKNCFK